MNKQELLTLERATERAIERLREIAATRRVPIIGSVSAETANASDTWIANALTEIADSLAHPLDELRRARNKDVTE